MNDTNNSTHDYSTGDPRNHHSLYLADADFVIQVENAIFRVHRYFLAKYSSVISDMFDSPQGKERAVGTDENPLVLTGDTACAWGLLLEEIYNRNPLENSKTYSSERLLSLLRIAHKYCMDRLEQTTIEKLKQKQTTEGYVDLIVAAQIIGSDQLYQHALQSLISSIPKPDLTQAKRIGVEAYHTITTSTISDIVANNASALSLARNDLASARADLLNARNDLASARRDLESVRTQLASAIAEKAGALATLTTAMTTLTNASNMSATLTSINNKKCQHCHRIVNWTCTLCHRAQT
ncbi:hypothetical protein M408DRAFT_333786 [Serendipita vermifera MAFF 305830]|uniref:BTB domain-containing protein n=1 Tax=Serendipita vermifera MAFF 305830 TaxID=933852 RepID=A0A0C2WTM0_SERVB|nr:hypothetical protein M408DRAFT_333786 [Serendipita vermifera MAFF 305830]